LRFFAVGCLDFMPAKRTGRNREKENRKSAEKAVDKKKKDVIQSIHSPLSESESGRKK